MLKRAVIWVLFFILIGGTQQAAADNETFPTVIDRSEQTAAWPDFSFDKETQLLEIWMPDIRDADAAILIYGEDIWMIDCGDERAARRLVLLMNQLDITRVDRLFNSHPHHDHLNGLEMTADIASIGELLICFPKDSTDHMKKAAAFAEERGIRMAEYGDGDDFAMGDGRVTLHIWQLEQEGLSMNDLSAQTMVRYGERSMLFTADMEKAGQQVLLQKVGAKALKADILKYPHHGKLTLDDAFLEAVDPALVVITNYRQFGDSYRYLKEKGKSIVYTNRDKIFLHLITDGKYWLCEYVPLKR